MTKCALPRSGRALGEAITASPLSQSQKEAIYSLLDTLICPLCGELFNNPFAMSCSHTFCRECLESRLLDAAQCPGCKEPIWRRDMRQQLNVRDAVLGFEELMRLVIDHQPKSSSSSSGSPPSPPTLTRPQLAASQSPHLASQTYATAELACFDCDSPSPLTASSQSPFKRLPTLPYPSSPEPHRSLDAFEEARTSTADPIASLSPPNSPVLPLHFPNAHSKDNQKTSPSPAQGIVGRVGGGLSLDQAANTDPERSRRGMLENGIQHPSTSGADLVDAASARNTSTCEEASLAPISSSEYTEDLLAQIHPPQGELEKGEDEPELQTGRKEEKEEEEDLERRLDARDGCDEGKEDFSELEYRPGSREANATEVSTNHGKEGKTERKESEQPVKPECNTSENQHPFEGEAADEEEGQERKGDEKEEEHRRAEAVSDVHRSHPSPPPSSETAPEEGISSPHESLASPIIVLAPDTQLPFEDLEGGEEEGEETGKGDSEVQERGAIHDDKQQLFVPETQQQLHSSPLFSSPSPSLPSIAPQTLVPETLGIGSPLVDDSEEDIGQQEEDGEDGPVLHLPLQETPTRCKESQSGCGEDQCDVEQRVPDALRAFWSKGFLDSNPETPVEGSVPGSSPRQKSVGSKRGLDALGIDSAERSSRHQQSKSSAFPPLPSPHLALSTSSECDRATARNQKLKSKDDEEGFKKEVGLECDENPIDPAACPDSVSTSEKSKKHKSLFHFLKERKERLRARQRVAREEDEETDQGETNEKASTQEATVKSGEGVDFQSSQTQTQENSKLKPGADTSQSSELSEPLEWPAPTPDTQRCLEIGRLLNRQNKRILLDQVDEEGPAGAFDDVQQQDSDCWTDPGPSEPQATSPPHNFSNPDLLCSIPLATEIGVSQTKSSFTLPSKHVSTASDEAGVQDAAEPVDRRKEFFSRPSVCRPGHKPPLPLTLLSPSDCNSRSTAVSHKDTGSSRDRAEHKRKLSNSNREKWCVRRIGTPSHDSFGGPQKALLGPRKRQMTIQSLLDNSKPGSLHAT